MKKLHENNYFLTNLIPTYKWIIHKTFIIDIDYSWIEMGEIEMEKKKNEHHDLYTFINDLY